MRDGYECAVQLRLCATLSSAEAGSEAGKVARLGVPILSEQACNVSVAERSSLSDALIVVKRPWRNC